MPKQTCGSCMFYEKLIPDSAVGKCLIYPPVINKGWPKVDEEEWCGQYKKLIKYRKEQ
tara:strand:+ start:588 stop:761 length:174 start_codon:yes stop_codon:yes gene_type:complete